jgi:hypothetical protein
MTRTVLQRAFTHFNNMYNTKHISLYCIANYMFLLESLYTYT